jgi:hypothetical protein
MNKRKIIIVGILSSILIAGASVGGLVLYFPTLHLPAQPVTMTVHDGGVSYFDIYLSDVPPGYDVTNGYYVGWCADRSVMMPRGEALTVRLYNTYDLLLPLPLRDKDWDKVNYILNYKGDADKNDVQEAFWHLLNDYPFDDISPVAQDLVNNAVDGFMPQKGQFIAVLAAPVETEGRPWPFQFAFLQMKLPPHCGLTPGFWKGRQHFDDWPEDYNPEMPLVNVFENVSQYPELDGDTLLMALNYGGGNETVDMAKILLRAAVAAVLNTEHPEINYPLLIDDLIAEVNEALGSHNRDTMETLKDILDTYNNFHGVEL